MYSDNYNILLYKNPKIISSEEIDLAPARPLFARVSPSYGSLQNLSKHFSLPKNDEWIDFSISNEINDANITLKIITIKTCLKEENSF